MGWATPSAIRQAALRAWRRRSVDAAAISGGEDKVTAGLTTGERLRPADLGELIAFLVTGKVRHLTGATIDVNGPS
ncbi:hypothetical protein [Falsiroseomonas oryzae]|uniref:hypothetical protein n=1 Tax=Falsiroseomonas oryzae TaxID=2766473 RepID=UPI0022EA82CA|nr:hypothetical protein [Roseomonas sp. MO-31]